MEMNAEEINKIEQLAIRGLEKIEGQEGKQHIIVPGNCHLETLHPKKKLDDDIRYELKVVEPESFIDYINKYKNETSSLFQKITENSFHCELDFHEKGQPNWRQHIVRFSPVYSNEWKIWKVIDGVKISQKQFLEFIEENAPDIMDPTPAELLDACANFDAIKKVEFKSAAKLSDGTIQFKYEENIEGGGKGDIKIPAELTIQIPVYKNDAAYKLRILVRYNIESEGVLTFTLKRHRPEPLVDDAFNIMAEKITAETELKPYAI